jgi:UDPglucose 6-dehydrogenase
VNTPPLVESSTIGQKTDLRAFNSVINSIGKAAKDNTEHKIIVNKSTVPMGTSELTYEILKNYCNTDYFMVVSMPEFLAEG